MQRTWINSIKISKRNKFERDKEETSWESEYTGD